MNRRAFLKNTAAFSLLTVVHHEQQGTDHSLYINGHIDSKGQHYVSGFDTEGRKAFSIALPDKAHGFAINPVKPWQVVSTPTLPGTTSLAFDARTGKTIKEITCAKGQHFNGHGCFSNDGQLFVSVENIGDSAEGVLSVRETERFNLLRQFSAYGIGPHEIAILSDNKTLVVAGGGIKTHPSSGKRELNISTMTSALLYINLDNGELLERVEIDTPRLSFRHLDISENDDVILACQYKGKRKIPLLVGSHKLDGGDIRWFDIDENNLWKMNQYTASVKVINNNLVAVSCPRGNILTLWDYQKQRYLQSIEIDDVGGIEKGERGDFIYASANVGELYKINAQTFEVEKLQENWTQAKWTNHMSMAVRV